MSAVFQFDPVKHQQELIARVPAAWRFLVFASGMGRIEAFVTGEEIVRTGDMATSLGVVVSGSVTAHSETRSGLRLFAYLGPGMAIGSDALVKAVPEPYTITAQEPTELFVLDADVFHIVYECEVKLREILAHLVHAFATAGNHIVTLVPHVDTDTGVTLRFERPGDYAITSSWTYGWGTIEVHAELASDRPTRELVFQNATIGKGRVIRLQGNRVVGVTVTGGWPDLVRLHELMLWNAKLRPWQRALFRVEGELYRPHADDTRSDLAVVCRCANVRKGQLRCAVARGATTVPQLAVATGASRVCGSCAPALGEVIGIQTDWQESAKVESWRVGHDVMALRIYPTCGGLTNHRPGQYLPVEAYIHGQWIRRNYTITSAPGSDHYEVMIKQVPGGEFSTWIHTRLQPESVIRFSEPVGDFTLADDAGTIVFYAGGIGVTPAIAQIRAFLETRDVQRFILDYSARTQDDFAGADELQHLAETDECVKVRFRNVAKEGYIDAEDVAGYHQDYPDAHHYLCGPAPFMQNVEAALKDCGVARTRVRKEHFLAPGSRRKPRVSGPRFTIAAGMVAVLAIVLWLVMPTISLSGVSVSGWDPAQLWYDGLYKQISGFSILGLVLLVSLISARKRLNRVRLGQFNHWRIVHLALGLLIVATLVVHTGFSLGQGLSGALLASMLSAVTLGGITAFVTLADSRKPSANRERLRRGFNMAHLVALSPIPVLLAFHIVAVYYF